ncbi:MULTISPECIES: L-aspartate oxidase [Caloramator]|uniref:L-aspartate oxidase n=1 Tax=Caloramator proteoclasticus DSM 10124 TaxID=1121262 RepID=A0A1M4Y2W0_9CLOT|nr:MULTISPECIES: L-aspartate oxidase [Caloramator]SHF00030.1 L-aspartate oxidase [Caloramator proteoclasticus DSM 10124]
MNLTTDVLIVGTGIAGLFTALNLDENINVILVTKSNITDSNSYLAQGGISTVYDENDIEDFIIDTLNAGNYKNKPEVVYIVAKESKDVINSLINFGVKFDSINGQLLYTKEGGHCKNRIVHHKDYTGKHVIETLSLKLKDRKNIKIIKNTTLIDLIVKNNKCLGGIFLNNDKLLNIYSKYTVLATGGIGGLFKNSTNTRILTGDALSISLRHNIKLKDIDYIQFHPTALYQKSADRMFLISESLRGEGAILKNIYGQRFVNELLPRDKVANKIWEELKLNNCQYVYLDISHLNNEYIKKRFPLIYNTCLDYGIDITKSPIPIRPAQHYYMGGIEVDELSRTSMNNLFAVGEVSCTGLHGNNRLASNSLLEGLVFGRRCANYINKNIYNKEVEILDCNKNIDEIALENKILFKNLLKKYRSDISDELV